VLPAEGDTLVDDIRVANLGVVKVKSLAEGVREQPQLHRLSRLWGGGGYAIELADSPPQRRKYLRFAEELFCRNYSLSCVVGLAVDKKWTHRKTSIIRTSNTSVWNFTCFKMLSLQIIHTTAAHNIPLSNSPNQTFSVTILFDFFQLANHCVTSSLLLCGKC